MDKFIELLSNTEFLAAIGLTFIISLVIATMVQYIVDTWKDIHDIDSADTTEYEELEVLDEELTFGCTVYDTLTERVGTYCGSHLGEDNNIYGVVVTVQDDTVYYFYSVLDALLNIKEQK